MNEKRNIPEKVIQTGDCKILGSNIRKIRKAHNMKQIEVIAKLELRGITISSSAYTKMENGTMNPKVTVLIALTEIFGCDFNALFKYN